MIQYYSGHNVESAIVNGLRGRGIDVLTAFEDGYATASDSDLLDRATALGRIVVTRDTDFLAEAAIRQRFGTAFSGIVYARKSLSIGTCVHDLDAMVQIGDEPDFENRVYFLPL